MNWLSRDTHMPSTYRVSILASSLKSYKSYLAAGGFQNNYKWSAAAAATAAAPCFRHDISCPQTRLDRSLTPFHRPAVAERSGTSLSGFQILQVAIKRVSFNQAILEVHAPPCRSNSIVSSSLSDYTLRIRPFTPS